MGLFGLSDAEREDICAQLAHMQRLLDDFLRTLRAEQLRLERDFLLRRLDAISRSMKASYD